MAKKKNAASRSKNPALKATAPVAKPRAKNAPPAPSAPKTMFGKWVSAARPRTLGLAIAPVAFGTGVATVNQALVWLNASLALLVAVFLQIGVNYANDYSDGIRGTDANRVGPFRLTASGLVKPARVRNAAFAFFALAAVAGLALVVITHLWWLLAVGAVCILAAWFYTGGKKPYGYAGFGEIVAFVFFGPVAVYGTAYVQTPNLFVGVWQALVAAGGALGLGFLAAAVLLVNNLRDANTDAAVGKRTLSVRIGATGSKVLFTVLTLGAIATLVPYPMFYPATILAYVSLLFVLPAILIVWTYRSPRELVTALKIVSAAALIYGLGLGLGLARLFIG
jgi:1,4-dihydroxy-2-naphthoate octaprenyltransferase